ncbi:hypothetical protein JCM33374_g5968 [Metschnikowia sp. JCM 33374]|nr:hypothetical protein JCM33374_g5968 [Metschnikowia sp. JCM 33374]
METNGSGPHRNSSNTSPFWPSGGTKVETRNNRNTIPSPSRTSTQHVNVKMHTANLTNAENPFEEIYTDAEEAILRRTPSPKVYERRNEAWEIVNEETSDDARDGSSKDSRKGASNGARNKTASHNRKVTSAKVSNSRDEGADVITVENRGNGRLNGTPKSLHTSMDADSDIEITGESYPAQNSGYFPMSTKQNTRPSRPAQIHDQSSPKRVSKASSHTTPSPKSISQTPQNISSKTTNQSKIIKKTNSTDDILPRGLAEQTLPQKRRKFKSFERSKMRLIINPSSESDSDSVSEITFTNSAPQEKATHQHKSKETVSSVSHSDSSDAKPIEPRAAAGKTTGNSTIDRRASFFAVDRSQPQEPAASEEIFNPKAVKLLSPRSSDYMQFEAMLYKQLEDAGFQETGYLSMEQGKEPSTGLAQTNAVNHEERDQMSEDQDKAIQLAIAAAKAAVAAEVSDDDDEDGDEQIEKVILMEMPVSQNIDQEAYNRISGTSERTPQTPINNNSESPNKDTHADNDTRPHNSSRNAPVTTTSLALIHLPRDAENRTHDNRPRQEGITELLPVYDENYDGPTVAIDAFKHKQKAKNEKRRLGSARKLSREKRKNEGDVSIYHTIEATPSPSRRFYIERSSFTLEHKSESSSPSSSLRPRKHSNLPDCVSEEEWGESFLINSGSNEVPSSPHITMFYGNSEEPEQRALKDPPIENGKNTRNSPILQRDSWAGAQCTSVGMELSSNLVSSGIENHQSSPNVNPQPSSDQNASEEIIVVSSGSSSRRSSVAFSSTENVRNQDGLNPSYSQKGGSSQSHADTTDFGTVIPNSSQSIKASQRRNPLTSQIAVNSSQESQINSSVVYTNQTQEPMLNCSRMHR